MSGESFLPDDVRRFVLTSIPSVPFLEAMLLLRNEHSQKWDSKSVAERLYMNETAADALLASLCAAGITVVDGAARYCYSPNTDELGQMIDRLADVYAKKLVEVTNLIHSRTGKKAQQFADAFKLRKD